MKKLLLIVSLMLTFFSYNSFAGAWFQVNANVRVTPQNAVVTVFNTFPGIIQCRGSVYGMNNYGQQGQFQFQMNSIGMGGYGYAYINPGYNSFLVKAYAQAQCRLAF